MIPLLGRIAHIGYVLQSKGGMIKKEWLFKGKTVL